MGDFISCAQWLEELSWIRKGDCIYVVSDVLELAKTVKARGERFSPDALIDKLQELVGEEGTLLFPTFNWDFCQGVPFDYLKTPVRTGALAKKALDRPEFVRTKHPLYSFAVWGRDQEMLAEVDVKDSFGPGTVFEYMDKRNAGVLVIGLPALKGVTYIHHVEQMVGVPYRYNKEFTGTYIDKEGRAFEKSYCMYVRDLEMDPRHIDGFRPLEEKMKKDGLIRIEKYYDVDFSFMEVKKLGSAVEEDILHNDSGNMYVYRKKSR